jgi:hypothetical protein
MHSKTWRLWLHIHVEYKDTTPADSIIYYISTRMMYDDIMIHLYTYDISNIWYMIYDIWYMIYDIRVSCMYIYIYLSSQIAGSARIRIVMFVPSAWSTIITKNWKTSMYTPNPTGPIFFFYFLSTRVQHPQWCRCRGLLGPVSSAFMCSSTQKWQKWAQNRENDGK